MRKHDECDAKRHDCDRVKEGNQMNNPIKIDANTFQNKFIPTI